LTNFKASKSNLEELLLRNNMDLDRLEKNTSIPRNQLDSYLSKKVMSLSTAKTIAEELNCQIEDLYVWTSEE
jgi:DNA-binding Xre family transcriptional regulator